MYIWTFLGICGITMTCFAISMCRKLVFEVSLLPKFIHENIKTTFDNLNFKDVSMLPDLFLNQAGIVIVASPTCAPCHSELEQLLDSREELRLPVVCFVDLSDENAYLAYVDKYQHEMTMYPATEHLIKNLGVDGFPSFYLVDAAGMVQKDFPGVEPMKIYLSNQRKLIQDKGAS